MLLLTCLLVQLQEDGFIQLVVGLLMFPARILHGKSVEAQNASTALKVEILCSAAQCVIVLGCKRNILCFYRGV